MTRCSRDLLAIATLCLLAIRAEVTPAQEPVSAYRAPRTVDGRPDLGGVRQAVNSAAWDVRDHSARSGVPAGVGVIQGGEIPYLPWASDKQKENLINAATTIRWPSAFSLAYRVRPTCLSRFRLPRRLRPSRFSMNGRARPASFIWTALLIQRGWSSGWAIHAGAGTGRRSSSTSRTSTARPGSTSRATFTARRCTWLNATREPVRTTMQ